MAKEKLIIVRNSTLDLYNEAGQCTERGFKSIKEVMQYAKDNDIELVESFFLNKPKT